MVEDVASQGIRRLALFATCSRAPCSPFSLLIYKSQLTMSKSIVPQHITSQPVHLDLMDLYNDSDSPGKQCPHQLAYADYHHHPFPRDCPKCITATPDHDACRKFLWSRLFFSALLSLFAITTIVFLLRLGGCDALSIFNAERLLGVSNHALAARGVDVSSWTSKIVQKKCMLLSVLRLKTIDTNYAVRLRLPHHYIWGYRCPCYFVSHNQILLQTYVATYIHQPLTLILNTLFFFTGLYKNNPLCCPCYCCC